MFGVPVRDPHWKHLVKSCTWSHVSCSMAFSCEPSGVVSSSGTESASEDDKKKVTHTAGPDLCRFKI